ncbi:MAG: FAD-binding oxidoreductase [Succinivibrio sp.]|nr:FAD-binding oxidoreductase [Succinivibrio sp.]
MIPSITNLEKIDPKYGKYLSSLKASGFKGDVEISLSSRLLVATDNSVYQRMPQGVIFPLDNDDIVTAIKLKKHKEFRNLVVTARGGGTGTNGQSLNDGITIDCSRHMKGTFNFDEQNRSIYVQAGVIKDELNEQLKPYGLFFSPELSTSNRATVGGMISNDAAGQGSLKYGRTSTHIKDVTVVLADGTLTTFGPVSGAELNKCLKKPGLEGEIYRRCYQILREKRSEIEEIFPKLNRFMTGYDLENSYDPKTDTLNLARIICGAEGTLAVICGATLDLTKIPDFRELMVVKYENFDSALRHAVELIDAGVFSVETVDSRVLNLAKKDTIWESVKEYIKDVPGHEILGINIVEFNGYDKESEHQKLETIFKAVSAKAEKFENGILGAQLATTPAAVAAVYGMRKKSVGLLGAAAGDKKLVAFTEDTVVPPRNLADYILEFRELLDSLNVTYGMFGHVDTGLMHVRPALDLTTDEDKQKLFTISNKVVELVNKYQGQMWGEHGRGYRSCYGEVFFKTLYPVAREIKEIFDKDNIFNPGKICVPLSNDHDKLVDIDSPMRGDLDRTIPVSVRNSFKGAVSCNGNGQCFSYQTSALMCPSYRYTKDHIRSPKGYSELMRQWMRMMNDKGYNIASEEISVLASKANPFSFARRLFNTIFTKGRDYSTEYLNNTKTCLSCKSCKSICPAHVNAADLNSRFLSLYYSRYLRPLMDLLILNSEFTLPFMSRFPRISNALLQNKVSAYLTEKIFGFVDLPKFSERTFKSLCKENDFEILSTQKACKSDNDVILVTDPFTVCFESYGLIAVARVIRSLGYKVAFLKAYVNGKIMVIRGDRKGFVHYAVKQAARLERIHKTGKSLVGYDPALTICYRDEYTQLLGDARGEFEVKLPEEWLTEQFATEKFNANFDGIKEKVLAKAQSPEFSDMYYLFTHCTERALITPAPVMWQNVMDKFGLKLLPVNVACCGMAGLFGHMAKNQDETYAVYNKNWKDQIQKRDFDHCLITGFSCRSQVLRMEGKDANHPLFVISDLLEKAKYH